MQPVLPLVQSPHLMVSPLAQVPRRSLKVSKSSTQPHQSLPSLGLPNMSPLLHPGAPSSMMPWNRSVFWSTAHSAQLPSTNFGTPPDVAHSMELMVSCCFVHPKVVGKVLSWTPMTLWSASPQVFVFNKSPTGSLFLSWMHSQQPSSTLLKMFCLPSVKAGQPTFNDSCSAFCCWKKKKNR